MAREEETARHKTTAGLGVFGYESRRSAAGTKPAYASVSPRPGSTGRTRRPTVWISPCSWNRDGRNVTCRFDGREETLLLA